MQSSPAQGTPSADAQSAAADLAHASDYRVRVSAALVLGRTRPEGARVMLEHALTTDSHPAVRAAAAAALSALGDVAAIGALERQMRAESSGSVRAQIQASVEALRRGSPRASQGKARYIVQLGAMRNATSLRGGDLAEVLRVAARAQAAQLPGAIVVDASDPQAARMSANMPVLLLDGQVTKLAQSAVGGTMRVEAQVEFSVRRVPQHILKGTLSGSATSMESTRGMTTARVAEMQDQAIGGAVESAMRGADRGLTLAAK